jgi:hypothetical protein
MLSTILSAISAVAAAVAAVCAVLALRKANDTIRVARRAQEDAERERDRHRIEHVGEIVEAIASASRDHLDGRVIIHRNRLRQAIVGLHKQLPECVKLIDEVKRVMQNVP